MMKRILTILTFLISGLYMTTCFAADSLNEQEFQSLGWAGPVYGSYVQFQKLSATAQEVPSTHGKWYMDTWKREIDPQGNPYQQAVVFTTDPDARIYRIAFWNKGQGILTMKVASKLGKNNRSTLEPILRKSFQGVAFNKYSQDPKDSCCPYCCTLRFMEDNVQDIDAFIASLSGFETLPEAVLSLLRQQVQEFKYLDTLGGEL